VGSSGIDGDRSMGPWMHDECVMCRREVGEKKRPTGRIDRSIEKKEGGWCLPLSC
jgi:hypothetical protein